MTIERGMINIIIGLTAVVSVSVVGTAYYSSRLALPSLRLTCRFPKLISNEINMNPDLYRLPKRNPFFYPRAEVSVALNVVSDTSEVSAQERSNGDIVYKGMVIWGEDKIAIFFLPRDKKTRFVKLGDFIEGYKVLDIREDTVVLSKQEGLSIMTLKIGGYE